jgi:hypothetical protein
MQNTRVAYTIVFGLGLGCGVLGTQGVLAPSQAVAQSRSARAVTVPAGPDLAERVRALEARLERIEGSVVVSTSGAVTLQGPQLRIRSTTLDVQTPVAKFAGTIQGKTIVVTNVVAQSYTPGAGNVW